jgi:hypothetical protein
MTMRRVALTIIPLAALVAIGCGKTRATTVTANKTVTADAPSTAATPHPALTKGQFIAQADSVCQAAGEATERFRRMLVQVQRESRAPTSESLPPILRRLIASERASVTKLQSLPEPAGDSTAIRRWLAAVSEAIVDQGNVTDALAKGDGTALRVASRAANEAKSRARNSAKAYGFRVCGLRE